jgi:hypothetical protein
MSKKDYELVADVIRGNLNGPDTPVPVRDILARAFADSFAASNPRFDRATFLRACGVEVSDDPNPINAATGKPFGTHTVRIPRQS